MEAIRQKLTQTAAEENIPRFVAELIQEVGAFPDRSIISAYKAGPAPSKLPDYVLALAIEETVG
jgi:hypothetical protein